MAYAPSPSRVIGGSQLNQYLYQDIPIDYNADVGTMNRILNLINPSYLVDRASKHWYFMK